MSDIQELIDRLRDARVVAVNPLRIDGVLKNDLLAFLNEVADRNEKIANENAWREAYKYVDKPCGLVDRMGGCPNCHWHSEADCFVYDCECPAYGFRGYDIALGSSDVIALAAAE